jgi:hypothetical protein
VFHQIDGDSGEHGQREEIEPVVLEYRNERSDVTGANVVYVAHRDLRTWYITSPFYSGQGTFQETQRTTLVTVPETPGCVEHIEMWYVSERHRRPVEKISGFEQRRVKCAPVEAHQQIGICQALGNCCEQRAFRSVACKKVLARSERSVDEPPTSDEKRESAGSAGEPRRFQIEKDR